MKRRNFFKAALASIAAMASGAVKASDPSVVDPDLKRRLDEYTLWHRALAEQEAMYNEISRRFCPKSHRNILRDVTLAITDDPK